MSNNRYGFGKKVSSTFEQALMDVTAALAEEGFGVLTEIDIQATLKKTLNKDMPPYRILGACNPSLAGKAFLFSRVGEDGLIRHIQGS